MDDRLIARDLMKRGALLFWLLGFAIGFLDFWIFGFLDIYELC